MLLDKTQHPRMTAFFVGVLFFDQFLKNILLPTNLAHKNYDSLFGIEINLFFATILLLALLWIIKKSKKNDFYLPTGLLLMGITSNMLDKIRFGFIIDYINLFDLCIFNVADLMILIGALIFIEKLIRE